MTNNEAKEKWLNYLDSDRYRQLCAAEKEALFALRLSLFSLAFSIFALIFAWLEKGS